MVFWSIVGGTVLGLFVFSRWFDRKRGGASSGRPDGQHHAAVSRAQLHSWTSERGDGSGKP